MPGQEDIEVTCELLAGKISFFYHLTMRIPHPAWPT